MENIVSLTEKRTISVHKEHEFLLKLEKAGLDDALAQKVIGSKDNKLAIDVVSLIRREPLDKSLTSLNPAWLRAREIMGKNFFGVEEAIKYFRVIPIEQ